MNASPLSLFNKNTEIKSKELLGCADKLIGDGEYLVQKDISVSFKYG